MLVIPAFLIVAIGVMVALEGWPEGIRFAKFCALSAIAVVLAIGTRFIPMIEQRRWWLGVVGGTVVLWIASGFAWGVDRAMGKALLAPVTMGIVGFLFRPGTRTK